MKNLKKRSLNFFSKYWQFLVLAFLVFGFFYKYFLFGYIPFPGDFVVGVYHPWLDYKWGTITGVAVKNPILADVPSFIYPMQTLAIQLIKQGVWPLWNPYILAGAPLMANFQSAAFSPLNLVYFVFNTIDAWSVHIQLQHLFAALFAYFLLRDWKVSKWGSVFGGLIYAFSGFNMIWSQWSGHTFSAALIPLIVLFADQTLANKGKYSGVGLSVAFATQIFAGYPQVIIYTAVAVGLLWFFRIQKNITIPTLKLAFYFFLGFGLSAVQLLPGMELMLQSAWAHDPHPKAWAFLPLVKTITFIAPDFFGNHSTANYWGPQDYTSNVGYVGVTAFVFATAALSKLKTSRNILYLTTLLLVTLILAYETPLSVFLWRENILGMNAASAHRGLVLFNLSVALLAGFGIDKLRRHKFKIRYFLPTAALLFVYTVYAYFGLDPINKSVALRNLVFPSLIFFILFTLIIAKQRLKGLSSVSVLLVLLLMIFELYRFGWKFVSFSEREYVFPKTPAISYLQSQSKPFRISLGDTIPVNLHMNYGLETLAGYETIRPAKSAKFLAVLNKNASSAIPAKRYGIIDNKTSQLLNLANTKYFLTLKRNAKGEPDPKGVISEKYQISRFKKVYEDRSVAVLLNKQFLPRAKIFYDWDVYPNEVAVLDALVSSEYDFTNKLALLNTPTISVVSKASSEIEYLEYKNQYSKISVETSDNGMLLVSDSCYPGWKALLDGNETEIYQADYAFRAVVVPKGSHIIEFEYKPDSFKYGLVLSTLSAFALAVISIFRYTKSK